MRKTTLQICASLGVIAIIIAAICYFPYGFSTGEKAEVMTSPKQLFETSSKSNVTATPKPETAIATAMPLPIENVDIVIFGSEIEGMYLARAAADKGLRVKILDPRPQKGGQILQAEMLFLDETWDDQHRTLLQGKPKELFDGFKNGKIRKLSEFTTYYDKLTKDIPLEQSITMDKVSTILGLAGHQAISTITYRTKDNQLKQINAGYWVENTDFGFLTNKLQVTRLPGLEKFYGADQIEYMSAGWVLKYKNVDWNKFSLYFNNLSQEEKNKKFGGGYVNYNFILGLTGFARAYVPTSDRMLLRGLNAVHQRDGEVLINALLIYGVDSSDSKSVAEAVQLGKKEAPLILEYFRKHLVGWENAEMNASPTHPYIREYNHYQTDYVLTVSDMLGARMFYDNVSIGGYPLDLQGTMANKWGIEMGRPDKYGMPLRSFLLKDYENVILAGKNVGSSAIAYGSARIQPNTTLAAESIGVILGELQGKKKLRELNETDWPALHTLLQTKHAIKLTGVVGVSRLTGWTNEELRKLNEGTIVFPSYKRGK